MKRIILSLIIVCFAVAGFAQTMNIQTGQITTAVNAGQAGDMTYENAGTELTGFMSMIPRWLTIR